MLVLTSNYREIHGNIVCVLFKAVMWSLGHVSVAKMCPRGSST